MFLMNNYYQLYTFNYWYISYNKKIKLELKYFKCNLFPEECLLFKNENL